MQDGRKIVSAVIQEVQLLKSARTIRVQRNVFPTALRSYPHMSEK
ncbi:hypothetical protein Mal48_18730 [Thalassoglobus polymorphus]|uniref:Uncharacterized protein n=1 Tax=Thalassoglobus polymorphus TaxID=2527994 RepID=A0A517QLW6_9PLAN|nr:hypothetical protein Mal48_18730 [Thalassoglobus polymorphus]